MAALRGIFSEVNGLVLNWRQRSTFLDQLAGEIASR